VEGCRPPGLNDRRAADPRLHGVTALRRAAVLGGNRRKPGREVPAGLSLECHGSDASVGTDTPLLGAGNEIS
jgi:hypothetical protein